MVRDEIQMKEVWISKGGLQLEAVAAVAAWGLPEE